MNLIEPISLTDLLENLCSGQLTFVNYLDDLEARFQLVEPQLKSFVPESGRFARLRAEAADLLAQYPQPEARPPLFGLLVGVKDIFHVDGFETRAGSHLPPEKLQGQESDVVSALKRNGALIMGKTVTTEFAYFGPGPTHNPHNLNHTPGGSSSGSAAAVAAGLCPLALGTQTIGSINRPAAFCGVAGFKPSYERLPRAGVIPLSPSLDHVGLFAQHVKGILRVASALFVDWSATKTTAKPVLGVPQGPYLTHASGEAMIHFEEQLLKLRNAGYQVKNAHVMPDFDQIVERHQLLAAADAAEVHASWYAQYKDRYHVKTVELIERGQHVSASGRQAARDGRAALRAELSEAMESKQIDLWITPPSPGAAPASLESTGDPIMNLPWTHAGLPSLTIPAGFNKSDMPLGVQLAGKWLADEQLLAWGTEIEALINPSNGAS